MNDTVVTQIGEWTVTLYPKSLTASFTKPGTGLLNLPVDVLQSVPANLDALAELSTLVESFMEWDSAQINELFDWIRSNIDLDYKQKP